MKKFIPHFFFLLLAVGVSSLSQAQVYRNYLKEADARFEEGAYYEASLLYKILVDDTAPVAGGMTPYRPGRGAKVRPSNNQYDRIVYQLAQSLRLYNNYQEAKDWYAKLLDKQEEFPLTSLYYGISLRASADYEQAKSQLQQFIDGYANDDEYLKLAKHELENCEFGIAEMAEGTPDKVFKQGADINEGGGNFASVIYNDSKLLFTSSRFLQPSSESVTGKANFNNIYEASYDGLQASSPELYNVPFQKSYHQGAISLSPDRNKLYLTRWQGSANGITYSAVYVSNYVSGEWSEPEKLGGNVNVEGFRSAQPFVSSDGKYLFFSSNRPGGEGGTDIWYCEIAASGSLGPARNLGDKINTSGDDESPYFLSANQTLFYSSNGRVGMGGFDVYEAAGTPGYFSEPENLGFPINSSRDDLYFTPLSGFANKGFVSSDRESVCCLELFAFDRELNFAAQGSVIDCDLKTPLAGVEVTLTAASGGEELGQTTTDKDGKYFFDLDPAVQQYKLVLRKGSYYTLDHSFELANVNLSDTVDIKEICMRKVELNKAVVIPNIYYDFDKATLRPESKLVLDSMAKVLMNNPKLVIEMSAHTDALGSDAYNRGLSQRRAQSCVDYLIMKGMSESRLIARGYGETKPIAPNTNPDGSDNPAGRQKNRRTEFKVVKELD